MTTGPKPAILGVVSGGLPSQNLACDHGTYYGTLGPTTREMITKALAYADPCGKVTTAGSCDGTVAVRCTDKFEGDRRLARIDCADLGMVCSAGSPGKVACVGKDEPVAPSATAPTAPAAPTAPTAPMN